MSVTQTTADLVQTMQSLVVPNQPSPARVFDGFPESVVAADLPAIIVAVAPNTPHTMAAIALGHAKHVYTMRLYVLLALRNSLMPNIYGVQNEWADAIGAALYRHLQLQNDVSGMGMEDEYLFTWRFEPAMQWGDGLFLTLVVDLPITEAPITTMQP